MKMLFSLESHVDAQALRTGNLSDADWEKLIEGAGIIGNSKLIFKRHYKHTPFKILTLYIIPFILLKVKLYYKWKHLSF